LLGIADPISSLTHLGGAVVFAALGVGLLARAYGNRARVTAVAVYVSGVVFALGVSGVFHLVERATTARDVLLVVDHAAIFFLIAATYTPVHVVQFRGFMRWGVLSVVWLLAVGGIVIKSLFFANLPEWISLTMYLGLGWVGLVSAIALYRIVGLKPLRPLIAGAIAYTVGACLDFLGLPNVFPGFIGPHEIFHAFVLIGVGMHWTYIRRVVTQAPITDLYSHGSQGGDKAEQAVR
jgi:channel protein (hemolysin III family)